MCYRIILFCMIASTSQAETLFRDYHQYTGPLPPNPYEAQILPSERLPYGYQTGYAGYRSYVPRAPKSYTYIPNYGLIPNE